MRKRAKQQVENGRATKCASLASGPRRSSGFTLIELLVVLILMALAAQMVLPQLGNDVPDAAVRSDAERLAATIHYIRSEARLRASVFEIEIDPERNRYRIHLPPEIRVEDEYSETKSWDKSGAPTLDWSYLSETVKFTRVDVGTKDDRTGRALRIRFDASGRTGQKAILLSHKFEKEIQYSIYVPPLTGQIVVKEGAFEFPKANDYDF